MANMSKANSAQCEVVQWKNFVESAGSKRRLTLTLRQEKTWRTDTVVLIFGYLTVSLHLLTLTSMLGRLIAFDSWR